jgi:hypothetical protein
MVDFDPEEVLAAARGDAAFELAARFWTGKARFGIGDRSYVLKVRDGQLVQFGQGESGQFGRKTRSIGETG